MMRQDLEEKTMKNSTGNFLRVTRVLGQRAREPVSLRTHTDPAPLCSACLLHFYFNLDETEEDARCRREQQHPPRGPPRRAPTPRHAGSGAVVLEQILICGLEELPVCHAHHPARSKTEENLPWILSSTEHSEEFIFGDIR